MKETAQLNPPPPDMGATSEERRLWEALELAADRFQSAFAAQKRIDLITTVEHCLYNRISSGVRTLQVLDEHALHEYRLDGAMILRGVYDAHLQALYILNKPDERLNRAKLFADFVHVERHALMQRFARNATSTAQGIANNAAVQNGMPTITTNFDKVKAKYAHMDGKGKTKYRKTWYSGDLSTLADELGYHSEYELMQRLLSAVVHSSPLALLHGPQMFRAEFLTFSWFFSLRVLAKLGVCYGISVSEIDRTLVDIANGNVFDQGGRIRGRNT